MLVTAFAISVLCQVSSFVPTRFVLNWSIEPTTSTRFQVAMDGVALVKHIKSDFVERATTTGGREKEIIADQFQVVQTQGYANRGSMMTTLSQRSSRSIEFRVNRNGPIGVQSDFEKGQYYLVAFQNPKGGALPLLAGVATRASLFVEPEANEVAVLWMMPCRQFEREATPLLTLISSGLKSIAYDSSIRQHEGYAHRRFSQLVTWPVNNECGLQMDSESRLVLVDRVRQLLEKCKDDPMRRTMLLSILAVSLDESSYRRDHFLSYLTVAPLPSFQLERRFLGEIEPIQHEYLSSAYVMRTVENRKDIAQIPHLESLITERPETRLQILAYMQLLDAKFENVRKSVLGRLARWSGHPELAPIEDPKDRQRILNEAELIRRWKTDPPLESWPR